MDNEKNVQDGYGALLDKIDNKDFTVYFYTVDAGNFPLASQYEAFYHASVLKDAGYKVAIVMDDTAKKEEIEGVKSEIAALTSKKDALEDMLSELQAKLRSLKDLYPKWMGKVFKKLDLLSLSSIAEKKKVSPADIFVIPEAFKDAAYQFARLNTKNILFVQDITRFFSVSTLDLTYLGDMRLSDFIVTTDYARDLIKDGLAYEGNYIDFHVSPPTIPSYFKPKRLKMPKVVLFGRNKDDLKLFHKAFTERHPELKWVPFEFLGNMTREKFADKISGAAVGVSIDRRATYGTFPMECIACGTYPAVMASDFDTPYMIPSGDSDILVADRIVDKKRKNGNGEEGFVDLVAATHKQLLLFLQGSDHSEFFDKVKSRFSDAFESDEKKASIVSIYDNIIAKRRKDIESQIKEVDQLKTESDNEK